MKYSFVTFFKHPTFTGRSKKFFARHREMFLQKWHYQNHSRYRDRYLRIFDIHKLDPAIATRAGKLLNILSFKEFCGTRKFSLFAPFAESHNKVFCIHQNSLGAGYTRLQGPQCRETNFTFAAVNGLFYFAQIRENASFNLSLIS